MKTTNRPAVKTNIEKSHAGLKTFLARKDIGFKDLPFREDLWKESDRLGRWISANASDLVLIGIGGSSLGPQLFAELSNSRINVHFADNVDPWQFQKISREISDWNRCYFLVISKSGTTLETLVTAELFDVELRSRGSTLGERAVVITEPKANSLREWAEKNKVETLEIPLDVGGRFSVLSPVGLCLASALGLSLGEIRAGARLALEDQEKIATISAEALESFSREEWITFMWTYSSGLRYFGLWFQQLWAESLAKTKGRKSDKAPRVSTPLAAIGTCDQHSLLQQVMEGARDKWVVQIRVEEPEGAGPAFKTPQFSALNWLKDGTLGGVLAAEAEATAQALKDSGVSIRTMHLTDLGPRSIGYLFMFWQLVVACVGETLDLDAFDQPGVELGKRLAKQILQN